jgi:hypothetical protein
MKKEINCPCGQYDYNLSWTSEERGTPEMFCPFCGILVEDEPEVDDEELDLDE